MSTPHTEVKSRAREEAHERPPREHFEIMPEDCWAQPCDWMAPFTLSLPADDESESA